MAAPPWEADFSVDAGKVLVGKENSDLLCELLHAHLAPTSMQAIKRARKSFKDIRGKVYPLSEDDLAARLPQGDVPPPPADLVLPTEISAEVETEPIATPAVAAPDATARSAAVEGSSQPAP